MWLEELYLKKGDNPILTTMKDPLTVRFVFDWNRVDEGKAYEFVRFSCILGYFSYYLVHVFAQCLLVECWPLLLCIVLQDPH